MYLLSLRQNGYGLHLVYECYLQVNTATLFITALPPSCSESNQKTHRYLIQQSPDVPTNYRTIKN